MSNRIEGAYPTIDVGEFSSRTIREEKKLLESYICERLIQLNIDKDVLLKQAQEINRLNAEINRINEEVDRFRWIPVEERLPEEGLDSVIGWDEYRERCVFVQYYDGIFQNMGKAESFSITHWMPLPEPYKEQVDGEAYGN